MTGNLKIQSTSPQTRQRWTRSIRSAECTKSARLLCKAYYYSRERRQREKRVAGHMNWEDIRWEEEDEDEHDWERNEEAWGMKLWAKEGIVPFSIWEGKAAVIECPRFL